MKIYPHDFEEELSNEILNYSKYIKTIDCI